MCLYVLGFELVGERKVKCCQSLLHCVTTPNVESKDVTFVVYFILILDSVTSIPFLILLPTVVIRSIVAA
jgi:hypothetical protein